MGWRITSWLFKGLNWLLITEMLVAPFGLVPAPGSMTARIITLTAAKWWIGALSVFSLFRGLPNDKYVIGSAVGYGVIIIAIL